MTLYVFGHHSNCMKKKFTLKWINEGRHGELYLKQVSVVYLNRDSAGPKRQVVSATAAFCCKMHLQANWTERARRPQPSLFMTSHPSSMCSSYHIQQPPLLASISFCRLMLLYLEDQYTCTWSCETLNKYRRRWETALMCILMMSIGFREASCEHGNEPFWSTKWR